MGDTTVICWPRLSIPIGYCCLTREDCSQLTVSSLSIDRQEEEQAAAEEAETVSAKRDGNSEADGNRLSMSIFGHVNASARQAREDAEREASSSRPHTGGGQSGGTADIEREAMGEASLEDWFGTEGGGGGGVDLDADRLMLEDGGGGGGAEEWAPEPEKVQTTAERVAEAARR
eukprot:SAG22_NODE_4859_length_1149_cov_1.627619_1_plen_174_part_00